jgi:hypothetical protein
MIVFLMLFIIACTPGNGPTPARQHTVGGTVSGLSGSGLVLQNNGGDDLSISADGTFTFATQIANGANYAVTVKTEPTGQTCTVDNGSGTVASANVTNVSVTCSTTGAWETLTSFSTMPAFSDFTPTGYSVLYTGYGSSMQEFTFPTTSTPLGVFTTLTAPLDSMGAYIGFAWTGGSLYMVQGNTVYAYNIVGDSWTKPVNGTLPDGHNQSQSTADDSGFVYSFSDSQRLLKYDTTNNTYEYIAAPSDLTTDEPRAAWDSTTQRVYLADYSNPNGFYAFNPVDGTFTALASLPDSAGMSDAFCSDRRGHIFTANSDYQITTDVWMYTAATDTWTTIAPLPFPHGSSAACTVSADGWLYFGDGEGYNFARIKVF